MPEYYIVCANPKCAKVKRVRRPSEQRRHKYCSRHCANLMHGGPPKGAASKGGTVRAQRCRARLLRSLAGLTPLEAFRRGYTIGLQSKLRQIHKRYRLVKIAGGRGEAA